jgi:spore coat polysaccharide biosynthesis protein SpsF
VTTLGILQARMTSSRLPGKVLEPILGVPMIGRQIERLGRASSLDGLAVATSVDASDDELVTYLGTLGVPVVRGSLTDVLGRFVTVLDAYSPSVVVRLTADCPLASPAVLDQVVGEFHARGLDYVSNTMVATYPDGVDVEVVRADALRWVAANSDDPHEHEHVTLGVYRRPERFTVGNVLGEEDLSGLRWTVDNADDLAFVREVYARLYPTNPEFELADVLALVRAEPALSRTTMDAARNAALDGLDTGAMKHG